MLIRLATTHCLLPALQSEPLCTNTQKWFQQMLDYLNLTDSYRSLCKILIKGHIHAKLIKLLSLDLPTLPTYSSSMSNTYLLSLTISLVDRPYVEYWIYHVLLYKKLDKRLLYVVCRNFTLSYFLVAEV